MFYVVDSAQDQAAVAPGSVVVDDLAVFTDEPFMFFVDLLDGGSVSYDGGAFTGNFVV